MQGLNKSFLLIAFLISILSFSQEIIPKWRFNFQLDNRISSIRNNEVGIFGTKVGVQYKKYTRFGLGVSFIANPVTITYFNKNTNVQNENVLHFWYVSVFNDWVLYKKNNLECFVTEQIGYGKPTFVHEVNSTIVNDSHVDLYVNEISGQVNYKIFSWVGAAAGFGYRNLFNKKSFLDTTFNAPIYIVKLIIYPETFFNK